jgi:hypothetical protein
LEQTIIWVVRLMQADYCATSSFARAIVTRSLTHITPLKIFLLSLL